MLKALKRYQVRLTPFQATKDWAVNNIDNDDLLLTEDDDGFTVEYIDYDNGVLPPVFNDGCNIALEQQEDDRLGFREGEKTDGIFYADKDPINNDGTYKRVVYSQIRTMFYNDYRNPSKILGLENIDFENSKTKRHLSEQLRLLDLSPKVFGDKIVPKTVKLLDNSLDDNFIITDDGNCNLMAGDNLFSRRQEIGNFTNLFQTGSDNNCSAFFTFSPPNTPTLEGQTDGVSIGSLTWSLSTPPDVDGFVLERSLDTGSTWNFFGSFASNVFTAVDDPLSTDTPYDYRVYAFNSFGTSSYSNVIELLIAGGGGGCSFDFDLLNNTYQIQGYVDGVVAVDNECDPDLTPIWDGIFRYSTTQGDYGLWASGDTNQYYVDGNGNCLCSIQIRVNCDVDHFNWSLIFDSCGDIWRGEKIGGQTPVGVYNYVSGTDTEPASLTIELGSEPAQEFTGSTSCCS